MNAPTSFGPGTPIVFPEGPFGDAAADALGMKWAALHEAAAVVAMLAGITPEPASPEQRNFPAIMRDAGGWRCSLAEQGIEDLSAVMEPGIAALLAVSASGVGPATAALALWQEFHAARECLLALLPPPESPARQRLT